MVWGLFSKALDVIHGTKNANIGQKPAKQELGHRSAKDGSVAVLPPPRGLSIKYNNMSSALYSASSRAQPADRVSSAGIRRERSHQLNHFSDVLPDLRKMFKNVDDIIYVCVCSHCKQKNANT